MQTSQLIENQLPPNESISPELLTLLDSLGASRNVDQNTCLFREGMEANEIHLIKSGLVQVHKLTADGKELSMRICRAGDIVGELTLFSEHATYFLTAKMITAGEVVAIDKGLLEKELMEDARLTLEFMKWTSNHMRKFQTKIRDLMLNGKKGALYSTLIRLSNSYGRKRSDGILIDIAFTNQELAMFCAATRESVNRMLAELRKRDKISIQPSGKILIKDLQFLRDEIGCENCPIELCNIN
ncbi:Crp/Fnr family transcriptional regulator [Lentibacillus sediminis]|uniref:Crp/Fnr family transcriptional regulator n=1 Tax=Lentibacillus sediminis TaxID=1940529 RepID=UPI000C1BEA82|nr:Crp/Fnr family transcriptional regulator [Lentibacillus sediminis]